MMLARIKSVLRKKASDHAPELLGTIPSDVSPAADPRIRALEALWGTGRHGPSSGELDDALLDALGFGPGGCGPIGLMGADPVLGIAARNRFGAEISMSEWRSPCAGRSRHLVPDIPVSLCDPDRPCGFASDSLAAMISRDAMVFAAHKSGLAAQVFRILSGGGVWILLDILSTDAPPAEAAFASAWSDPQLIKAPALEAVFDSCGFEITERVDASSLLAKTVASGFKRISIFANDMDLGQTDLEHALMLNEIAWEAASWKARLDAMQDGQLQAILWTVRKPEQEAEPDKEEKPSEESADT